MKVRELRFTPHIYIPTLALDANPLHINVWLIGPNLKNSRAASSITSRLYAGHWFGCILRGSVSSPRLPNNQAWNSTLSWSPTVLLVQKGSGSAGSVDGMTCQVAERSVRRVETRLLRLSKRACSFCQILPTGFFGHATH